VARIWRHSELESADWLEPGFARSFELNPVCTWMYFNRPTTLLERSTWNRLEALAAIYFCNAEAPPQRTYSPSFRQQIFQIYTRFKPSTTLPQIALFSFERVLVLLDTHFLFPSTFHTFQSTWLPLLVLTWAPPTLAWVSSVTIGKLTASASSYSRHSQWSGMLTAPLQVRNHQ
jgi:hypothetical protein